MGDAIEPSEILSSQRDPPKEKAFQNNPQIRLLARFFDYGLFFLCICLLHVIFGGKFPFSTFEHLIPIEYFSWIPIEALLLFTWGTTPGKFLLKVRIRQGRKKPVFQTALKRSFNVWLRGIGMGIPVVNVLCMLVASNKLRLMGMTSWDREDNFKVSHSHVAKWRSIFAGGVIFIGFITFYSGKYGWLHG